MVLMGWLRIAVGMVWSQLTGHVARVFKEGTSFVKASLYWICEGWGGLVMVMRGGHLVTERMVGWQEVGS